MSKLRMGEWMALLGGVALLVLLGPHWYETAARVDPEDLNTRGCMALGWPIVALLVLLALLAIALAVMTATRRSPSGPVALAILTWVLGAITLVVLAIRLIAEPDLGAGLSDVQVTTLWPAYLGLLATLLITVGAFRSVGDDRTDTPASRYEPPPARSVDYDPQAGPATSDDGDDAA